MSRVVEINCVEHLQRYRLAWTSLWQRTRRASFCQTLDWFEVYFRCDADVIRPRVLLVLDDDDEPIGILPLAVHEEMTNVGSLRVLGYPLMPAVGLCGPVGSLPTVTLIEGLRHIAKTPRDWDLLDLRGIEAAFADGRRTTAALGIAGLAADVEPWQDRAVVEFDDVWSDYWETRDPARRGRIDHMRRKLERRAEVTHVRYRPAGTMHADDDPRWDLYADCRTIARRSWQAAAPDGLTLSTPLWDEFFRRMHQAAAQVGTLDLNLLYVDDVPAAFAYNYVAGDYVTRVTTGYDANFANDGVGTLLTWLMMRQSHAWGDRIIDFGSSTDDWKRFWLTRRATSLRAIHYPPRPWKTQLLRWGRTLKRTLTAS